LRATGFLIGALRTTGFFAVLVTVLLIGVGFLIPTALLGALRVAVWAPVLRFGALLTAFGAIARAVVVLATVLRTGAFLTTLRFVAVGFLAVVGFLTGVGLRTTGFLVGALRATGFFATTLVACFLIGLRFAFLKIAMCVFSFFCRACRVGSGLSGFGW